MTVQRALACRIEMGERVGHGQTHHRVYRLAEPIVVTEISIWVPAGRITIADNVTIVAARLLRIHRHWRASMRTRERERCTRGLSDQFALRLLAKTDTTDTRDRAFKQHSTFREAGKRRAALAAPVHPRRRSSLTERIRAFVLAIQSEPQAPAKIPHGPFAEGLNQRIKPLDLCTGSGVYIHLARARSIGASNSDREPAKQECIHE